MCNENNIKKNLNKEQIREKKRIQKENAEHAIRVTNKNGGGNKNYKIYKINYY